MLSKNSTDEKTIVKPAIRWAGGKRWLASGIREFIPQKYNDYYEPFLGGAAMFLNLDPPNRCYLSDTNAELINFYKQVRYHLDDLLGVVSTYRDEESFYYKMRSTIYLDKLNQAARFYYLNRTNFNGLYRVNQQGLYNVPYGKRNLKSLYEITELTALKRKLSTRVRLSVCDFEESLKNVKAGDFVFIDPPYTVAHNNNGFVEYNQTIFSWQDQERLAESIIRLDKKKVFYVLTNAVHNSILSLYKGIGKKYEIERNSTISGHMQNRKKVSELIVTNCI